MLCFLTLEEPLESVEHASICILIAVYDTLTVLLPYHAFCSTSRSTAIPSENLPFLHGVVDNKITEHVWSGYSSLNVQDSIRRIKLNLESSTADLIENATPAILESGANQVDAAMLVLCTQNSELRRSSFPAT